MNPTLFLAATDVSTTGIIQLILGSGGALVVLIVVVWSIRRGDFIPRQQHEAIVKAILDGKDAVIALETKRGDEWKVQAERNSALATSAVITAKEVAHP